MNEREIDRVASLLKKQGLASSFLDAKKLAENIVATRRVELDIPKDERKKAMDTLEYPGRVDVLEQGKDGSTQEIVKDEQSKVKMETETKPSMTLSELMAEMDSTSGNVQEEKQEPSEPVFKIADAKFDEIRFNDIDAVEIEDAKTSEEKKKEEEE